MSRIDKFKGIIPAFYACYDKNGAVSGKGVEALTEYFIAKGVKGVYVGGSSGECIYQSVEERKLTLEHVVKAAQGKLTIIAHVAANNTADSCLLAEHAQSLGVDAIAAIPPIYFKLPPHAIEAYWNEISNAAPNTPFIIYNIPQLAGVSLTVPILKEMQKNQNLIGVKNSSLEVLDIRNFKNVGGDDFVVFNGPDEQYLAGRIMGADGGIGGTYGAMPELYLQVDKLLAENNHTQATALQKDILDIIYALCSCKGNMYAVIKEVLRINNGIDLGEVRPPLTNLQPEDFEKVHECAKMIKIAIATYC